MIHHAFCVIFMLPSVVTSTLWPACLFTAHFHRWPMEWWFPLAGTLILGVLIGALFLVRGSTPATKKTPQPQLAPVADRRFTAAEVALHQSAEDCWLIIDKKVYDVTPYIAEHPGGDAIFRHAGCDVTEGFNGPQHPPRVFDLIDDFYVGDLQQS